MQSVEALVPADLEVAHTPYECGSAYPGAVTHSPKRL